MTKQESGHPKPNISHGLLLLSWKDNYSITKAEQITDILKLDITYTHKIPPPSTQPIWTQNISPPESSSALKLYQEPSGWRLDIECLGKGTFLYREDGIEVYWSPEGTDATHYLFGIGLAIWFELHGTPCLHGNSLEIEDHAIALIGVSQAGKSTLTAALLQKGFSFLTDDLIVPRQTKEGWILYPAPGSLGMWPASIEHFLPNVDIAPLEQVHASSKKRLVPVESAILGKVCHEPKPLKAIYLLDRDCPGRDSNIHIEILNPADALIALISNSIAGGILTPLSIEQNRLNKLTQLVKEVPVKRIHYPNGYQHLNKVRDFIVADLFCPPLEHQ